MNNNQYKVAIIGCGSIGALKDDAYDSPNTDAILTHAHAAYRHPRTNMRTFVDINEARAESSSVKWTNIWTNAIVSISEMKKCGISADIVVVAVPTEHHRLTLLDVLSLKPKLVIAEKPFCSTLQDAKDVATAYELAGVPLLVDYIRRFDFMHRTHMEALRDGKMGDIYHARCIYGRGIKHDGCHGLDIFNWVFGKPVGLTYSHAGIIDRCEEDPSYTVHLEYAKCKEVYMVATDSRKWGSFEMEFVTEKGILRFPDWGKQIRFYGVQDEQTFGQYRSLDPVAVTASTHLDIALLHLMENAVRHIEEGDPLHCTAHDAINVHEILQCIGGCK